MDDNCFQTEMICTEKKFLSKKLAAINNEVRFLILKIIRDYDKSKPNKGPLYSREINLLLTNFNINITPQMLGQHLKILVDSDLLDEIQVKKEIPNKIGRRSVKAYVIKSDAFQDLFLDINFFSDELLTFFELYDTHNKFHENDCCILTIFNGKDKGKTFKVHKDETIVIGRKSNYKNDDFDLNGIYLDNSYKSVSNISKPHLKLFYEDGNWNVIDEKSANGTFIGDRKIPKGDKVSISSNSFIKLARGSAGAVIYCSF